MAFAAATAVQQKDSHTYTANFSGDWVIGSVPHGGYVTATFQQVITKHFSTTLKGQNQPHTLALHLDFLRRTQTGPATFFVKDVKLGRQTSVIHVALRQENREEVVGYFTQSNLSTEQGVSFPTTWQLLPPRAPVDLARLEAGEDAHWAEKPSWPNPGFRKATQRIRSWFPRAGQPATNIYDSWMCFRDGSENWTNESLGFLADMFPQLLERYVLGGVDPYAPTLSAEEMNRVVKARASTMWYPTLLLNLDVKKALPAGGVRFLFSRLQAKEIRNGRYDLEIVILDSLGEIVALSHHVCFAVSAERNVQQRRKVEEAPGWKL